MKTTKYLIWLSFIFISFSIKAQQPFLQFKPEPKRVDKFDYILSTPPFKLISAKISLAVEMRLKNNFTLKLNPSYLKIVEPFFVTVNNLEIQEQSNLENFEEQSFTAMLKRYRVSKGNKVYFGTYLGFGMEALRTNLRMSTQIPNFEKATFDFSTNRKTLILAIGTTKLFSKRIIFDFYTAIKYQYNVTKLGNFDIQGIGYKPGFSGGFGFTIGAPIGRRKI